MMLRTRWMMGLGAVLAAAAVQAASTSRVPVIVNDQPLPADALMLNGVNRTVLPMRTLFESLGARVEWDPAEQAVYAWTPDGTGVRLALGYRFAQTLRMARSPQPGRWGAVTGTHPLDAPAMMIGDHVYVPIRFAAEALHADVRYAAYEPAVHIRTERVAGIRQEETNPDADRLQRAREEQDRLARERADRERSDRDRLDRGQTEPGRTLPPRRRLEDVVSLTLDLPDDRFTRQERVIPIRLSVRNESGRRLAIPFNSGQQFDVEILQEGKLLWNWARERAFTQAATQMSLAPDEERTFTVRWNLRTNGGARVAPGRYTVRGILTTTGRRDMIAEQVITIE